MNGLVVVGMTVMSEEATRLDRLCEMRNVDASRCNGCDKGAIFLYNVDYGRYTFVTFSSVHTEHFNQHYTYDAPISASLTSVSSSS